MSNLTFTRSCKGVVTFLKGVINANCVEGFKWFPEVNEEDVNVSVIDMLYAIEILEKANDQKLKVKNDEMRNLWKKDIHGRTKA